MASFLFAWNPKVWPWNDLPLAISEIRERGFIVQRWACGSRKQVRQGDRVFLIRLGLEPKGIFGSGVVVSKPYRAPHYVPEKARAGRMAWRVDVRFDKLLDPEQEAIIPREQLVYEAQFATMHWDTQMSGVSIPEAIANVLEEHWARLVGAHDFTLPEEVAEERSYPEGAVQRILVNAYERNATARKRCIAHYVPTCSLCGFDFAAVYGPAGAGLIHVHHLKPLAEIGTIYSLDPIRDLRPVCPNCHAIIHRRDPAYTFDQVKAFKTEAGQG